MMTKTYWNIRTKTVISQRHEVVFSWSMDGGNSRPKWSSKRMALSNWSEDQKWSNEGSSLISAMSRMPLNCSERKCMQNATKLYTKMKYTVNARCVDFNIDHSIFRLTSSANVYWKIVTQNFNSFNIAWHRISSRTDHERSSCGARCLFKMMFF